jgi:hypothetical protein
MHVEAFGLHLFDALKPQCCDPFNVKDSQLKVLHLLDALGLP